LQVIDRPGVLAQIAAAFGEADVSIKSVWQEGADDEATLLIVTHRAPESRQQDALRRVRSLDCVNAVAAAIRVESDEA
jgi:homoserine dehydrogenase